MQIKRIYDINGELLAANATTQVSLVLPSFIRALFDLKASLQHQDLYRPSLTIISLVVSAI